MVEDIVLDTQRRDLGLKLLNLRLSVLWKYWKASALATRAAWAIEAWLTIFRNRFPLATALFVTLFYLPLFLLAFDMGNK
jgi:hypothetical protein